MDIFVTGPTGYLGSALVRGLVAAGHRVTGLVRSPESAARLEALGGVPLAGDLGEPEGWRAAAAEHDAILHLGMQPGPEKLRTDRVATEALLAAVRESGRVRGLVYTSTTFVLGDTGDGPVGEDAAALRPSPGYEGRAENERLVLAGGGERVACAVVRPGMVYGGGNGGSVSELFRSAAEEGAAAFVGDGRSRWPLVHRDDLAELYRAVAERSARGIFHGVDGTALAVSEVARAASEAAGRGGAVRSIPLEEARGFLGGFADALVLDQVVDAPRSTALGWRPAWRSFPDRAADAFRQWTAAEAGAA